jgi:hypothetical protein
LGVTLSQSESEAPALRLTNNPLTGAALWL